MQDLIVSYLQGQTRKRIRTKEIEDHLCQIMGLDSYWRKGGYLFFAQTMEELVNQGILRPIVSWKQNGMKPLLYNGYSIQEWQVRHDPARQQKILTYYHPLLEMSQYLADPQLYESDEIFLHQLDRYFKEKTSWEQGKSLTINERSFQIFRDEKWLASTEGQAFLHRVGINLQDLACHLTYEPFFYYQVPGSALPDVLIVENKDTFFTFKRALQEGWCQWDGKQIGLLIYGEGRKIVRSFDYVGEVYPSADKGNFWYFGDLDWEGISIWYELFTRTGRVHPFILFYQTLVEIHWRQAPALRTKQRLCPEAMSVFLAYFPPKVAQTMEELLEESRYLPQEGINGEVLLQMAD
jgi:hypothetical protein